MTDSQTIFKPIKSPRTFEAVSAEIKKMILSGNFNPGDKLPPEAEIASQFGVGRQSVREALRILELSGFVVINKGGGGGVIVKDRISSAISNLFLDAFRFEKTSLEELTAARLEIEKIVLKYAVENAEEDDVLALRKNLALAREKIEKDTIIIDENIQFHQILAKASKNNLFVIVVGAITATVRHCMSQISSNLNGSGHEAELSEQIIQSNKTLAYHEDIIAAVEERNKEKATATLESHLLEVKNRLIRIADRSA